VRDRAVLARLVEGGRLENVYRLQIMNATETSQRYRIAVEGLPGLVVASDTDVTVAATEARWVVVRLQAPYDAAPPGSHAIAFLVTRQEGSESVREKSVFIVPQ